MWCTTHLSTTIMCLCFFFVFLSSVGISTTNPNHQMLTSFFFFFFVVFHISNPFFNHIFTHLFNLYIYIYIPPTHYQAALLWHYCIILC